jgi:hypothetical protein
VILREKNWSEQGGDVQSVVPRMKTEGTIRSYDMGHFRISVYKFKTFVKLIMWKALMKICSSPMQKAKKE